KMQPQRLLFSCLTLWSLWSAAWTARILLVFPYDFPSQCMLLTPYIRALVERGHELTLIHAFNNCDVVHEVHAIYAKDRQFKINDWFEHEVTPSISKFGQLASLLKYLVKMHLNVLEDPQVQQLMRSGVSYDLFIIEPSYTDALFGLAAHFNATAMGLATCGADWNMDGLVGYKSSSALETISSSISFKPDAGLLDQLYNWMQISEEWLLQQLIFLPQLRSVHTHFFGHLAQSFEQNRQSFSLILLNQHFSLFESRANVPGMVEVGGMHVPKQLPALAPQLARFIAEAEHGVVYISLGNELQSKDLSAKTLQVLLHTFESLPQRVIWRFETEATPNASSNIYFGQWLPQQAILAHPNLRLFINHGGMLSIIEAAHYGKPMLGLPLFFDQARNVERLVLEGTALSLDINALTKHSFDHALRQLLCQPQYRLRAQALSQRVRDVPLHPLDSAIYWTEYVLRYKGAAHMRVSSANIKLTDYYCLDHLLIIFVRFGLIFLLVVYILFKLKSY
ncbi:Ugt86Dj, partial [Drosophila busckii]